MLTVEIIQFLQSGTDLLGKSTSNPHIFLPGIPTFSNPSACLLVLHRLKRHACMHAAHRWGYSHDCRRQASRSNFACRFRAKYVITGSRNRTAVGSQSRGKLNYSGRSWACNNGICWKGAWWGQGWRCTAKQAEYMWVVISMTANFSLRYSDQNTATMHTYNLAEPGADDKSNNNPAVAQYMKVLHTI